MNLTLTIATTGRSACLRVDGDLDYATTADLLDAVSELLSQEPGLAHLCLDCSTLNFCDSAGLSGLLFIYRRTFDAGIDLHLDHRPRFLDRILDITSTSELLVSASHADPSAGPAQRSETETKVR